jgi:hypothetical protein
VEENFAMKTSVQRVHQCTKRYFINETMRSEQAAIRELIDPIIGVPLKSAIAHMVKRNYTALGWSDSCIYIYGTAGYSIEYRVWFHIEWPHCIYEKTTKFIKGKDAITIMTLNSSASFLTSSLP